MFIKSILILLARSSGVSSGTLVSIKGSSHSYTSAVLKFGLARLLVGQFRAKCPFCPQLKHAPALGLLLDPVVLVALFLALQLFLWGRARPRSRSIGTGTLLYDRGALVELNRGGGGRFPWGLWKKGRLLLYWGRGGANGRGGPPLLRSWFRIC